MRLVGRVLSAALGVAMSRVGSRRRRQRPRPSRGRTCPLPLRPWIDWVLRGHEDRACPFLHGEGTRACIWPGSLALELDARGGRFRQSVFVARESDVALPGGGGPVWPEDVRVGGSRMPVAEVDGLPRVRLGPGSHAIEGRFAWTRMPPGLRVPNETGLVELVLDGRRVPRPRRDAEGAIWLREASVEVASAPVENRVELEVARRFQDARAPATPDPRDRCGPRARRAKSVLGVALPEGWLATAIGSPLPARTRSGRSPARAAAARGLDDPRSRRGSARRRRASRPPKQPEGARWDESEVWSIALAPELRLVELTGAPSIDPTQAEIPGDWHALPSYRLDAGTALELVEKRRGNEGSPGDQLTLERTWYLDFDGGGATVLDRLQGTLRRSLRLEMGPGTELGRVAIDQRRPADHAPRRRRSLGHRDDARPARPRCRQPDSRAPAPARRRRLGPRRRRSSLGPVASAGLSTAARERRRLGERDLGLALEPALGLLRAADDGRERAALRDGRAPPGPSRRSCSSGTSPVHRRGSGSCSRSSRRCGGRSGADDSRASCRSCRGSSRSRSS